jgi:D-serine dehydratase
MKPLLASGRVIDESVAEVSPRFELLRGDLLLPVMVAKEGALRHNLEVMAAFCDSRGVSLAPHAKTTMAPRLVQWQLEAGAWGMTVATSAQAHFLRSLGVERILLANEVVEPAALAWILAELEHDPDLRLLCLADSLEGVAIMAEATSSSARPLEVLVEVGVAGGRAGCRTIQQAVAVANAITAAPGLLLAGVECFEGILGGDSIEATLAQVDALLDSVGELTTALDESAAFADAPEIIVSAGGSAYFDRVVARLCRSWELSRPVRIVLRSGCYLAHDSGHYARISPLDGRLGFGARRLVPALEIWGAVLSLPEPDLGIVGFGKRDVPYDLELPTPSLVRRRNGELAALQEGALTVTALNDQHAYIRGNCGELAVGDWIACGISHPCTAFDKWSLIPLVDGDYAVVDVLRTFF